jgi:hypothetical protein
MILAEIENFEEFKTDLADGLIFQICSTGDTWKTRLFEGKT